MVSTYVALTVVIATRRPSIGRQRLPPPSPAPPPRGPPPPLPRPGRRGGAPGMGGDTAVIPPPPDLSSLPPPPPFPLPQIFSPPKEFLSSPGFVVFGSAFVPFPPFN